MCISVKRERAAARAEIAIRKAGAAGKPGAWSDSDDEDGKKAGSRPSSSSVGRPGDGVSLITFWAPYYRYSTMTIRCRLIDANSPRKEDELVFGLALPAEVLERPWRGWCHTSS